MTIEVFEKILEVSLQNYHIYLNPSHVALSFPFTSTLDWLGIITYFNANRIGHNTSTILLKLFTSKPMIS